MSCNSTDSAIPTPSEEAFFVGLNLQNVLYGVELVLFFQTMQIYLARGRTLEKSDMFYVVYSTVMVCLLTLWVTVNAIFAGEMWLRHRNYPDGPANWAAVHADQSGMLVGSAAVVVMQEMNDALMMYRCRVVWGSRRGLIIPVLLGIICLGLGISVIWASSNPGFHVYTQKAGKLALTYYSTSVFLHATLTTMICYQIARHAKVMKECLGEEHAAPYLSVVAILIESVLPSTLAGIACLTAYGARSPADATLQRIYIAMMVISPQMLILRAAQGLACHKDTMKPVSVIRFAPRRGETSVSVSGIQVESFGSESETPPESSKDDKV